MLRRINLSYVASGAMLVWLVILFARLRFGNQPWQDVFQILVGVLFTLYGLALVRNWRGAGEAMITHPPTDKVDPRRYQRAGYLWMFGGVLIVISAIILIVTRV